LRQECVAVEFHVVSQAKLSKEITAALRKHPRSKLTPAGLAQLLKDEIGAGRYAVGAQMPTEVEMQQRFGVSRYCARAAFQALKDSGMVSARAGIGHQVLAAEPADQRYMQSSSTLAELVQLAQTTLHVLDARDGIVDAALSQQTGHAVGAEIVEITALRTKRGANLPTALLNLSLHRSHAMMARYMEGEAEPFHIVLERRYGVKIAEVQQRIISVDADAKSSRILQCAARQPCLKITRRFLDAQGAVIFASVGLYPSDRFSHDTAFKVNR